MNGQAVMHDERTDSVVGMSCRLSYALLMLGVLLSAAIRGLAFGQECWDLLGLVLVSNVVGLVYQRTKHAQIIPLRWMLLCGLGGAVIAVAIGLLRQYF